MCYTVLVHYGLMFLLVPKINTPEGLEGNQLNKNRNVGWEKGGWILALHTLEGVFLADSFRPFTSPKCQSAALMSDQNNLKPRAIRLRPG